MKMPKIPRIPKLPKRTWALIVAVLLIVAAVPALGVVRFTTSHPFFCLSCHRNQEAAEMWLPSRVHPASATCTDCHTSPGDLIPRKFSASDELMNQNCTRCHSTVPRGEQTDLAEGADRQDLAQAARGKKGLVHRLPPEHRARHRFAQNEPSKDGELL